jgi:hypothetical protein
MQRLGGEPCARQLGKALGELREEGPTRRRADDRVGQLPVELLRDLERDRLRALARVRVQVAADEAPREERAELELEPAAVVVGAVDCEDTRTGVARRDGRRPDPDGGEHDRLEPGRGGGGADGVSEVPGRGAAEGGHAVVESRRRSQRRDAVLVGAGGVLAFELEVQVDAERIREQVRAAERRRARTDVDVRPAREERGVAPERRRPGRDRRPRDRPPDARPVVEDVGRPVTAPAGVDRLGDRDLLADAAAKWVRAHLARPPVFFFEPNR